MSEFVVVGLDNVQRNLALQLGPLMLEKVAAGLERGGFAVQAAARANLAPHHYHGTAEQQTTVSPPLITAGNVTVTVGIHGGLAPEGRPLEFGWASAAGKQPPTKAIAEWLTSKPGLIPSANVSRNARGFVRRKGTIAAIASESAVRGMAFVIARNIKRRGYSFGSLHWLDGALDEQTATVLAELQRACRIP